MRSFFPSLCVVLASLSSFAGSHARPIAWSRPVLSQRGPGPRPHLSIATSNTGGSSVVNGPLPPGFVPDPHASSANHRPIAQHPGSGQAANPPHWVYGLLPPGFVPDTQPSSSYHRPITIAQPKPQHPGQVAGPPHWAHELLPPGFVPDTHPSSNYRQSIAIAQPKPQRPGQVADPSHLAHLADGLSSPGSTPDTLYRQQHPDHVHVPAMPHEAHPHHTNQQHHQPQHPGFASHPGNSAAHGWDANRGYESSRHPSVPYQSPYTRGPTTPVNDPVIPDELDDYLPAGSSHSSGHDDAHGPYRLGTVHHGS